MTADPYSKTVRERFATTPHAGAIDDGVSVSVDDQGVQIRLSATVDAGSLTALRFLAWGCPHLIAATEQFCADFEGRDAAGLLEFSASGLMKTLAVPAARQIRPARG